MKVTLRPWEVRDAKFCCVVRNRPELQRWFRQDEPINLVQQIHFIETDLREGRYNGYIVEADGKAVGIVNVKSTNEFGIAILTEYQKKGIATKAMKLLLKNYPDVWSEVFVDNPALSWYLKKLGFTAYGVEERAYFKKGIGLVDVVKIRHGKQLDNYRKHCSLYSSTAG